MSSRDPGHTTGDTTGYPRRPDCQCRHMATVHTPNPRKPAGRGPCTAHNPAACPCTAYQPKEDHQ